MKNLKNVRMLIVFCLIIADSGFAARVWPAHDPIPGEYIVVLNEIPGLDVDRVAADLTTQYGGSVILTLKRATKLFGARMTATQAEALALDPRVNHVEQNGKAFLSTTVDFGADTSWWHLDRIDQHSALNALRQYSYTYTGSNVNVYVLDTGILASHEQFYSGQVTTGATYGDGLAANNPCGRFPNAADLAAFPNWGYGPGHGTAVASLIGGITTGVAKNVTLVPVKVYNCNPSTGDLNNTDPATNYQPTNILWWCWALDWIYGDITSFTNANRRAVVNQSNGFLVSQLDNAYCAPGTLCLPAFENNVRKLILPVSSGGANAVYVAAANNHSADACNETPARMAYGQPDTAHFDPNTRVITVGGSDESDQRWVRTTSEMIQDQPSDVGSNYGPCVDIYAPAHNLGHLALITSNTAYRTQISQLSGTSFAAPIVTGIAARLLDQHHDWTPRQVWDYISQNATLVGCFDPPGSQTCVQRLAYISGND